MILLFVATIMTTFSCSESNDGIVGVYRLLSFGSTECEDPDENISFDFSANDGCQDFFGTEVCGSGSFSFTEAGFFILDITLSSDGDSFSDTITGQYTLDGQDLTVCVNDECKTSNFSLRSGKMTFIFPNPDASCVVSVSGEKE